MLATMLAATAASGHVVRVCLEESCGVIRMVRGGPMHLQWTDPGGAVHRFTKLAVLLDSLASYDKQHGTALIEAAHGRFVAKRKAKEDAISPPQQQQQQQQLRKRGRPAVERPQPPRRRSCRSPLGVSFASPVAAAEAAAEVTPEATPEAAVVVDEAVDNNASAAAAAALTEVTPIDLDVCFAQSNLRNLTKAEERYTAYIADLQSENIDALRLYRFSADVRRVADDLRALQPHGDQAAVRIRRKACIEEDVSDREMILTLPDLSPTLRLGTQAQLDAFRAELAEFDERVTPLYDELHRLRAKEVGDAHAALELIGRHKHIAVLVCHAVSYD